MESVLVSLLAPFLSQLLGRGEQVLEAGAERLGGAALDLARRVWAKVSPQVEAKEAAREAADELAERPDDERAQGALELQLQKLLSAAPGLAGELQTLLDDGKRSGVLAADGSMVIIGGDVRADRGGVAAGRDLHIEGSVVETLCLAWGCHSATGDRRKGSVML